MQEAKYWRALNVVHYKCHACGYLNEFQIEKNKLVFGYSYAAGTAHFAGGDGVAFPGITAYVKGEGLVVRLGREMWNVMPIKHNTA
jgi:hypothetical protein